jgi:hypothetical protein
MIHNKHSVKKIGSFNPCIDCVGLKQQANGDHILCEECPQAGGLQMDDKYNDVVSRINKNVVSHVNNMWFSINKARWNFVTNMPQPVWADYDPIRDMS